MATTRRQFLKHLAVAVTAAAVAPAALIDEAGDKLWDLRKLAKDDMAKHVWVCEWLTFDELEARFPAKLDKNPLFRGELGSYSGVTIYNHT